MDRDTIKCTREFETFVFKFSLAKVRVGDDANLNCDSSDIAVGIVSTQFCIKNIQMSWQRKPISARRTPEMDA